MQRKKRRGCTATGLDAHCRSALCDPHDRTDAAAAAVLARPASFAAPLAKCPDLTKFRSPDHVLSGFDEARLAGMWYEQAYIDVAQVGASCQTLNGVPAPSNEKGVAFAFDFKVDYGPLPFTITELYTPRKGDGGGGAPAVGFYTKNAKMPMGKLLNLPTVFVDVTAGNATRADGSAAPYETMTLYSCIDVLGALPVTELVFATRAKAPGAGVLAAMEASARAQGVAWNDQALKHVDHSKCK